MFYTDDAEFAPNINANSQKIVKHLAPLSERAEAVQRDQERKLSALAEQQQLKEREQNTFRPRINDTGKEVKSRLSAAPKERPAEAPLDPEVTHAPKINTNSRKMAAEKAVVSNTLSAAAEQEVRKRVRELWRDHVGGSKMPRGSLRGVLSDMHMLPKDEAMASVMEEKFATAMKVDDAGYVAYDNFTTVIRALLRKARASQQPVEYTRQQDTPVATEVAERREKCTFKPKINNNVPAHGRIAAKQLGIPEPEPSRKVVQKSTVDRELERCTFVPATNGNESGGPSPSPSPFQQPSATAPGFHETITRMREARMKKRETFEDTLRKSSPEATDSGAMCAGRGPIRHEVGHTEVKPFHFEYDKRQQRKAKPLMYVDVDLPSGKTGRIGVHEGDTATSLARSFASSYSLNRLLESKLCQMLEVKIRQRQRQAASQSSEAPKVFSTAPSPWDTVPMTTAPVPARNRMQHVDPYSHQREQELEVHPATSVERTVPSQEPVRGETDTRGASSGTTQPREESIGTRTMWL